MKFNRINQTTIQFIITQTDLKENGIDLDDILEHKPRAMEYLRSIMQEAQKTEDFRIEGDFATMQLQVLPDQSLRLTFSQNAFRRPSSGRSQGASDEKKKKGEKVNVFIFPYLDDAILCCKKNKEAAAFTSSLYRDRASGEYYLFLSGDGENAVFEKMLLTMNEFGSLVEATKEEGAYAIEHGECIIEKNAVSVLSEL